MTIKEYLLQYREFNSRFNPFPVIVGSGIPLVDQAIINDSLEYLQHSDTYGYSKLPLTDSMTETVDACFYPSRTSVKLVQTPVGNSDKPAILARNPIGAYDARINGGGYRQRYIEEHLNKNKDLFNVEGIASYGGYPLGAHPVLVIDIPAILFQTYTVEELEEICKKHADPGTLILIRKNNGEYGCGEFGLPGPSGGGSGDPEDPGDPGDPEDPGEILIS